MVTIRQHIRLTASRFLCLRLRSSHFLVDTQTPSLCQAYMHYIAPNSLSKCLVSIITIFKSSGIYVLLLAVYCVVVAILREKRRP
jgi:hypothetical protein